MESTEIVRGNDFLKLLTELNIPARDVYEDLSETGVMLWTGARSSIKLISEYGYPPSVQIVIF